MSRSFGRTCGVVVLGAILGAGVVSPSRAQDERPEAKGKWPQKPHWDPAWSHANVWDYTLASVSLGAIAVEGIALPMLLQPTARWVGPILFDADVRNALRINNATAHDAAQVLGWALWGAQAAYPIAVDVPYAWARYGWGLARDLLWQDAVTLFFAVALDFAVRDLVGRARPYTYQCIQDGGTNCIDNLEAVRSFPGGHFLNATAASVLTCTQHLYVHLYGDGWDGLTCAMTLASDAAVGLLRIASDWHWASDELLGGVVGALIGWGVPYIMHFRGTSDANARAPSAIVVPMPIALDHGGGLGVAGLF